MTQSADLNPILERLEAEASKLAININAIEQLKPLTDEIELVRECVNYLQGNLTFTKSAHDETLSALKDAVSRWHGIREEMKAHVRIENSELFKKVKASLESTNLELLEKLLAQSDLRARELESLIQSFQNSMSHELTIVEERLRGTLPSKMSVKILTALMVLVLVASVSLLMVVTG